MQGLEKLLEELAPIVKDYEENKKKRMDTGFNVFYLISDNYYRETFHGDVLCALLSPKEKHNEGNLFVELFIDMINKEKPLVKKDNYCKVQVEREYGTNDGNEKGRIDLLIVGEDKHCIVIENKLNNAPDTIHQLPKYRKDLVKKGCKIDAFVYIPLDQNKEPDKSDWEEEEKQIINDKLVIIPAYKTDGTNLVKDWLAPAEKSAKNEDARFIIKQYKTLLNNLTIDIMDNKTILDTLVKDENFNTTMAIMENYEVICSRIIKEFFLQLGKRVKDENIGVIDDAVINDSKITIKFYEAPFWSYTIEYDRATHKNWQYCRYWQYSGKGLPGDIKAILPNSNSEYPLGWENFGEIWNQADTLKKLHDGTFLNEIIAELKSSLEIIRQL